MGGTECGLANCGCGIKDEIINPRLVTALDKYEIKQISAGVDHTAILTTDGKLLIWGRADDGRLGLDMNSVPADHVVRAKHEPHPPIYLMVPREIPDTRFTMISCGDRKSVV